MKTEEIYGSYNFPPITEEIIDDVLSNPENTVVVCTAAGQYHIQVKKLHHILTCNPKNIRKSILDDRKRAIKENSIGCLWDLPTSKGDYDYIDIDCDSCEQKKIHCNKNEKWCPVCGHNQKN